GHRERVGEALLAGLGVGVAGVDHRGADVVLVDDLAADADRRGGGGVAGEDHCRVDVPGVADEQTDVGHPAALQAAGDPGGAEAGRELGGVELGYARGGVDPARPEEAGAAVGRAADHRSPSVSSRPSIRFRFWTPWPEAPFQMLSIAEKAITLPRSSTVT